MFVFICEILGPTWPYANYTIEIAIEIEIEIIPFAELQQNLEHRHFPLHGIRCKHTHRGTSVFVFLLLPASNHQFGWVTELCVHLSQQLRMA